MMRDVWLTETERLTPMTPHALTQRYFCRLQICVWEMAWWKVS